MINIFIQKDALVTEYGAFYKQSIRMTGYHVTPSGAKNPDFGDNEFSSLSERSAEYKKIKVSSKQEVLKVHCMSVLSYFIVANVARNLVITLRKSRSQMTNKRDVQISLHKKKTLYWPNHYRYKFEGLLTEAESSHANIIATAS